MKKIAQIVLSGVCIVLFFYLGFPKETTHISQNVYASPAIKTQTVIAPIEVNPMADQLKLLCQYPLEHMTQYTLGTEDYDILLKIVEAEAGGEPMDGRILVANVILNRMNSTEFPDTICDVVYQTVGGSPQFTPTADGRINEITVSEGTVEAVNRALEGEDLSDGALYFMSRSFSDEDNVTWFDTHLTMLFTVGGHTFYR